MMGLIFGLGVAVTFLFIGRWAAGSWADLFKGLGFVLLIFAVGAVAIAVLFGIIALWAFISMALTGNLP